MYLLYGISLSTRVYVCLWGCMWRSIGLCYMPLDFLRHLSLSGFRVVLLQFCGISPIHRGDLSSSYVFLSNSPCGKDRERSVSVSFFSVYFVFRFLYFLPPGLSLFLLFFLSLSSSFFFLLHVFCRLYRKYIKIDDHPDYSWLVRCFCQLANTFGFNSFW